MRIIGGTHSRRIINPPKNLPVRPTTDMAKEGLFNILSHKISFYEIKVLDLFAGTGAISYEFASRGSSEILAIDKSHHCTRFIKSMANQFDFDQIKVIKTDVYKFIKTTSKTFDLVFADPPYSLKGIEDISGLILDNNLLMADGILIIEHPKEVEFSKQPNFIEHRKYGHVNFSFFGT